MNTITTFLTAGKLARKQSYKNLTLFPLLAPEAAAPDYLTLEQALEQSLVEISELDQDGSVPELRLINKGKQKVLIIEGEELVGAKQNRIVNATFLVAAASNTIIPVSCVEQGRWRYDSDRFGSGKKMMHASLRRNHQVSVRESLKQGRGYQSNQGEIWEDISAKLDRMKVSAPTRAMADAYDSYADKLSDYIDKFQIIDCQIGAVFAIDGQVLGLESFGCSDTFGRFFEKIVKSYALDALDSRKSTKSKSVTPEAARRFIQSASKGKTERHPTLGLGEAVSIESRVVSGAALTEESQVIHLSAFRKIKGDSSRGVNYRRYSERYRRRRTV
ncbi:MAG: DUF6569 family protein [Thermodesulfobacteriota bacterium]